MNTLYRRWLILCLIPRYGNSITVSQIADQLSNRGVERASVRTIQRDLEEVTMLEKSATMPDGFSLQGYIESGEFSYPVGKETIRLKALFDRDAAAYLHETPLPGLVNLTEDAEEETVLLEAELLDSRQLRWWLRGFGDAVEVLEPLNLREEFRETAKILGQIYG